MKKRSISILLILTMVLTMLPVTAGAANPDPFKEVKSVPIASTQYARSTIWRTASAWKAAARPRCSPSAITPARTRC